MPYKDIEKQREAQRNWATTNRHKQRDRRSKIRRWLDEYKQTLKCSVCEESCWVCLDFHHVDPSTKDKPLSVIVRSASTIEKVKEELAKCVVLCANCHRKHHAGIV